MTTYDRIDEILETRVQEGVNFFDKCYEHAAAYIVDENEHLLEHNCDTSILQLALALFAKCDAIVKDSDLGPVI